jgi:DNA-binding transcriptional MerR regulator
MAHRRVTALAAGAATEIAPLEYTIDQLAQATGVTVRNIRAHQSRGLLPPPEVRGRTGYYGPEHVARLQLIIEMQANGFNLNAIKRILDSMPPGSAGEVLSLERALQAPWGEEQPEIISVGELAEEMVGQDADPALLKKAIRLGLVTPLGDGQFEVASPTLLRAGVELARLGIPLGRRLEVQEQLKRHASGVAEALVKLFLDELWKPFNQAGQPESDWPRIREALDRLKPLATETLVATFHLEMSDAVDRALGKVLQETVKVPRRGPGNDGRRRR